MGDTKDNKFLTKQVMFGGKEITMHSLDGVTWSSRREEVPNILERHEKARVTLTDPARGEEAEEAEEEVADDNDEPAEAASRSGSTAKGPSAIPDSENDDLDEGLIDEEALDDGDDEVDGDDEAPVRSKSKKAEKELATVTDIKSAKSKGAASAKKKDAGKARASKK